MFSLNLSPRTHRRTRRLQRVQTDASRAGAVEALEVRTLLADYPLLASRPDAAVTLFIDGDGHTETSTFWTSNTGGAPIVTPPYDSSGDTSDFTDNELREVTAIWSEVAEDFAPFDVNVTTIDPGTYNDFETMVIVLGGDGSWFGGDAGGVAPINAFSNSAPNVGFAFSELQGTVFNNSLTVSHEAGHGFGLEHQSLFDDNGNKIEEYHPGFGEYGPIMGAPFTVTRSLWANDLNSSGVIQDDMARLTRAANRTFHFREDDHGSDQSSATEPSLDDDGVFTLDGVIEEHTDLDWIRIDTDDGTITFDLEVLDHQSAPDAGTGWMGITTPGTNLNTILTLRDSSGAIVTQDRPTDSYAASLEATVTEGTYFVEISVEDIYGTAGAYTLTGDTVPLPKTPTMLSPNGIVGARPLFTWTSTINTQSYELQVDNTTTGEQLIIHEEDLTTTSFAANFSLNDEHSYRARVRSLNNSDRLSAWSEYLAFSVDVEDAGVPTVETPFGLENSAFPLITWTAAQNAETYDVRVRNTATNEVEIFRTGLSSLSYRHFVPLENGDYETQARGVNEAGQPGIWSSPLDFTIEVAEAEVPQVLTPGFGTVSRRKIEFTWTPAINAVSYDLQVQNLSTGDINYIRNKNIETTRFKPSKKFDEGSYLVRVRAEDVLGRRSEWSDPVTITVDIPTPGVPELANLKDGDVLKTQKPLIKLTKRANRAVKYELVILNADRDDEEVLRKTITGAQTLEYQVRKKLPQTENLVALIASINSVGERSEFKVINFGIDVARSGSLDFVTPSVNGNGTINDDKPTFSWTAATNVNRYELIVRNANNGRTVLKNSNIRDLEYRFSERLDQGVPYEVTVVGINTAGERGGSATVSFTVDVPEPDTPVMFGPQGDITQRRPVLDFELVNFVDRFQVFVKDLDTNSIVRYNVRDWTESDDGEVASYRLPDQLAKGTYQAWVRAFNSRNERSGYSNQVTFTIVSSDSVPDSEIPQPGDMAELVADSSVVSTDVVELPTVADAVVELTTQNVLVAEVAAPEVPTGTPEQTASAAAIAELTNEDWWELMMAGEHSSEVQEVAEQADETVAESDESPELSSAELGVAAAAALPIFAGKLLKRVRRKKKKNN